METRKIGSLDVSVVGLGCINFGRRVDATETAEILGVALDAGINFLDTADIYSNSDSESYLGQAIKGRRGDVVLATKFGCRFDEERGGASPQYVRRALEDSLRRLDTDYIDLYQMHTPDESVPIADTLAVLNDFIVSGKVREIGCSNFTVAQLLEAETAAGQGARFASVQNHYSLLYREAENGVLGECARQGIGFIPYYPVAGGKLTGKYRLGQPMPTGTRVGNIADAELQKIEALVGYAESKGHTILELAFSWLLAQNEVASVIAGATSVEQARANARAANWVLSVGNLIEIDILLERFKS